MMRMRLAISLLLVLPALASFTVSNAVSPHAPAAAADADAAPSTSPDSLMQGKRLLLLGNFLLGDFDSRRKAHHESVEGQMCEFAARQGVTIDIMLWDRAKSKADTVYALCIGEVVFCGKQPTLEACYETLRKQLPAGATHAAIASRDDERIEETQILAEMLKLPGPFVKGTAVPASTAILSFLFFYFLFGRTARCILLNC